MGGPGRAALPHCGDGRFFILPLLGRTAGPTAHSAGLLLIMSLPEAESWAARAVPPYPIAEMAVSSFCLCWVGPPSRPLIPLACYSSCPYRKLNHGRPGPCRPTPLRRWPFLHSAFVGSDRRADRSFR